MKIRLTSNPLIAATLALALQAGAIDAAKAAEAGVKADHIVIGQSLSLNGGRDVHAVALGQGVKLYLDATNNSGGIAGRKIHLRVLDDAAKPANAEANSLDLISTGVFALLGSNNIATNTATAKVANDFRVPVFAMAARNHSGPISAPIARSKGGKNAGELTPVAPSQPMARSAQLIKEFENLANKTSPRVAMTTDSLDGFEAAKAMVVALKTIGDPPTRAKLSKVMVASGVPTVPSLAGRNALAVQLHTQKPVLQLASKAHEKTQ